MEETVVVLDSVLHVVVELGAESVAVFQQSSEDQYLLQSSLIYVCSQQHERVLEDRCDKVCSAFVEIEDDEDSCDGFRIGVGEVAVHRVVHDRCAVIQDKEDTCDQRVSVSVVQNARDAWVSICQCGNHQQLCFLC